ncbi:phosphodiester glycosidase family protein, partial [Candidatus Peregrinibacteria bacterium]|nr:phosphodiester glycosidase family protein [Candidatus Peregrinibacteria bacterium]
FFTEEFQSTGLLISRGKTLHDYQKGQLINGIFLLNKNHQPKLIPADQDLPTNPDFAIQNGPILLDDHSDIMVDEKLNKSASRTAIGIDKDNHIIVIFLRQSLLNRDNTLTLLEFARILANSDYFRKIGLHSVLNLDGGTSTGLAIGDEYFPELAKVQNIIITKPQSS